MSKLRSLLATLALPITLSVALVACGGGSAPTGTDAPAESAKVTEISGAGATFPYPIYAKWADAYKKESGNSLNYQSIGSGGGVKQIKARTVTFGASDAPLTVAELEEAGLVQFPMVMGGVVPVLNVEGIAPGQLVLDGATLANIFLGKITQWNDAAIAALNPEVKLPELAIAVVHRSDGSGTTHVFTHYLGQVSPDWTTQVGVGKSVEWPVGIGGKGNEGVANSVKQTLGAIGYVEYAYAKENAMPHARMINRDGVAVNPDIASFQAAAAGADWANTPGYDLMLTFQPGAQSWPITGASFILIPREPKDAAAAQAALKFFDWSFRNGADMATTLDYVPMPANVVELVEKTWQEIKDPSGKPLWP